MSAFRTRPPAGEHVVRRLPALRLLVLAGAAAATLAGPGDSQAREAPPTGMFSGAIDLAAPSPEVDPAQLPKGRVLLRVYRDGGSVRITGYYVALRTFCPGGAAVQDVRLDREPASGKGPRIGPKGGFALRGNGIRVRGTVTRQRAEGTVVADARGGCHGHGTFRIARRPGS